MLNQVITVNMERRGWSRYKRRGEVEFIEESMGP
ncbi:hypothetical protein PEDI_23540 [Persicobacter diffluens]|uniref:Uncharacterized protein n=1 Tax=Persicobacter diffluens TaxID=981 RepID=A0AAN4VZZ0_9BACT|nr:hypothetical protein PEDI_23540 [Persicobacter diffluens]